MKTTQTLSAVVIAKTFTALAVAAAGFAHAPVALASPDDGAKCIAGFAPEFNGTALKCVKKVTDQIDESRKNCNLDGPFGTFRAMALGQRDICINSQLGVDIGSGDDLGDFANGGGGLVLRLKPGAKVPASLSKRTGVPGLNGALQFSLNENADFIFYDRSKSAKAESDRLLALAVAKAKLSARVASNGATTDADGRITSLSSDPHVGGTSRDRVEVKIDVFTFPVAQ